MQLNLKNSQAINSIKKVFILTSFFAAFAMSANSHAETALADNPVLSTTGVPGNVALALSVEFPTALGSAYTGSYDITQEYVGYWDEKKCYAYNSSLGALSSTFQGPYNTGVGTNGLAIGNGANDPHWTAVSTPGGITNDAANNVNHIWGHDADSAYIGGNSNNGTFVYATSFTIPTSVDPALVQISFELYADDRLDRVRVNGIDTGIGDASIRWNASGTITIPAGTFTTTGTQIITLDVFNTGGPGGIRVDNMVAGVVDSSATYGSYFEPKSYATGNHVCNAGSVNYWSGNFLNWALTQTIDPFRYALSGGYRSVDNTTFSILEKAWATGQGGTVANPSTTNNTVIAQSTPFQTAGDVYIRINGLGNKFYITRNGNNWSPGSNLVPDGGLGTTLDNNKVYEMFARVRVCVPGMLEENCTKYPSGYYKPTGLIQKNAMRLNFAAFGYLLDDDLSRDGGVLRARMQPLGPEKPTPGSSAVANPNAEWDALTGVFYDNPHPIDATASSVTNSGVINYLNKFGLTAKKYKTFDPVGELYYATTRYLKGQGNVAAYTSGLTTANKDGFPVITDWNGPNGEYDPVQYSCQSNFIIGVGDTNTHADNNLPGSEIITGKEPTMPAEVAADNSIDVSDATNKVSELEGLPGVYANYGDVKKPFCCNDSGALMAGIAYDSHTKDIRPDIPEMQTIDTYFLDVLEAGDRKDVGGTGMWNQFWLAAKYGGFQVPDGFSTYGATAANAPAAGDWDADGNGDPDNYFRANDPKLMIDGLNKAFDDIVFKVDKGFADGFAVFRPNIYVGDIALGASYNGDGWTGNVSGGTVSFDANNDPIVTKVWDARDKLDAQAAGGLWATKRFIATSNCALISGSGERTCSGVAFKNKADLSTDHITSLEILGNDAQDVIDFLRGDRTKEGGATNFRIRKHLLGDIIDSEITLSGPPNGPMSEVFNPGYGAFKTANANRTLMAYVGANDGMLHAFNAVTGSLNAGTEQFAYIPSVLFDGPNATPNIDGLAALTKQPYLHHRYVDAAPAVQDIYLNIAGVPTWQTLLVGGLAKGGKGYYALDVTTPANLNNESNLASAVMWEFTHKDLGYSYAKPIIVKINNTTISYNGQTGYNGWAVIVTSGYNNADVNGLYNGYFFVLDPSNGNLIAKIPTSATMLANDVGLANVTAWIPDAKSFVADAAYAGDLMGNVWRLNLNDFSLTKLATLDDGGSPAKPQPITVKPEITVDKATNKRYIMVGTGRLLDDTDISTVQTQSIYTINDGSGIAEGYLTSSTLSGGISFPLTRANLNNNSVLGATTGIVNPTANSFGWYIDMTDNYLINTNLAINTARLAVAANKVDGTACDSSSAFRLFQLDIASGRTLIPSSFFYSGVGNVKALTFYRRGGTNDDARLNIEFRKKKPEKAPETPTSSALDFKQLNWRDLPTAD